MARFEWVMGVGGCGWLRRNGVWMLRPRVEYWERMAE